MSWFSTANNRDDIIAEAPFLAETFHEFYRSFWQLPMLPVQTLELCRLRIAQLHQCDTEWQREEIALPAAMRKDLSQWNKSASYSAAEQACLEFAEVYTMDPQAISDEQADAVKAYYSDAGLVALIEALGMFYGLTRVSQLWELPAN